MPGEAAYLVTVTDRHGEPVHVTRLCEAHARNDVYAKHAVEHHALRWVDHDWRGDRTIVQKLVGQTLPCDVCQPVEV